MFVLSNLINSQSLASLAGSTRSTLQDIAAQVQTRWQKQHGHDGAHKDVTASSLVLSGLFKANGRLNIGAPLHLRRPVEADTQPFYLAAGGRGATAALATHIRIQTSSLDPSPFFWHGLDAAGREEGDLVFLVNVGNEVVEFVVESASAPANSRFKGNSTSPSGHIELHSSALGIAVYTADTSAGEKFWRLLVLM